ncbi:MAG TPA: hypothetical protein VFU04_09440, partial [Solirubrobacterales bacterium]|nr:hypothetical protein [Solirubrobacterales bacterium]
MKRMLGTSIGSAMLGGAIVGALFMLAIAAGWVDGEEGSSTTVTTPIAAPVAVRDGGEDANLVN